MPFSVSSEPLWYKLLRITKHINLLRKNLNLDGEVANNLSVDFHYVRGLSVQRNYLEVLTA